MKLAALIVAAVTVAACAGESGPHAPVVRPNAPARTPESKDLARAVDHPVRRTKSSVDPREIIAIDTAAVDTGKAGPGPVPPTGAGGPAFLWGMVVDSTGVCIVGATVHVVAGQRAGQSISQSTPCDAWAYDGGFMFTGLTPGVAMTLRASAPGYADLEQVVTPSLGPQLAVLLQPAPQAPIKRN